MGRPRNVAWIAVSSNQNKLELLLYMIIREDTADRSPQGYKPKCSKGRRVLKSKLTRTVAWSIVTRITQGWVNQDYKGEMMENKVYVGIDVSKEGGCRLIS